MNQNENQNDLTDVKSESLLTEPVLANTSWTMKKWASHQKDLTSILTNHPGVTAWLGVFVLLCTVYSNWNSLVEGIVVLSGEVFEVIKNL